MQNTLKIILIPLLVLFFLTTQGISLLQNYFNQPESVVYDEIRDRYLVSNKGNGNIIELDYSGNQSVFKTGLVSSRGLVILHDTLFVACDLGIVGIDLETAATVTIIPIPGMQFLNDICADSSGNLYASDSDAGRIYKIVLSTQSVTTLINYGIPGCNGLLYRQQSNSLLVCLWPYPGTIREIDLNTLEIITLVQTNLDECDGLAVDGAGYVYVSSFIAGTIYRYDPEFSQPKEMVSSNHEGPADIFFNVTDNILAVPNFHDNSVELVPVTPVSVWDLPGQTISNGRSVLRNYPNPFSTNTTISFYLPENQVISLHVINMEGRTVSSLISNRLFYQGEHRFRYLTGTLKPGIYWLFLSTDNEEQILRKIVITL